MNYVDTLITLLHNKRQKDNIFHCDVQYEMSLAWKRSNIYAHFLKGWQMIIRPFMLGGLRELFMATDSLFILSSHPPVLVRSITRDLEWEKETEHNLSGAKQKERKRKDTAQCGNLFMQPAGLRPPTGRQMLMRSSRSLLQYVIMDPVDWFFTEFYVCVRLATCIRKK